ncbi:MAG: hypothetical protein KME15_18370 [Drouetiella hepatica Uher 2000/2452]|uniref:Uncharacterized protein n=1 Tax=Drouetiella hepatica Uher 2000/2452 TaxID=904376 RepID=A0A951QCA2_9CYAN|nr:hypothetical protein [Drouetiella hepatica Uher 2000/2452]
MVCKARHPQCPKQTGNSDIPRDAPGDKAVFLVLSQSFGEDWRNLVQSERAIAQRLCPSPYISA